LNWKSLAETSRRGKRRIRFLEKLNSVRNVSRKLGVMLRRNSDFEFCGLAGVTPLDDLSDLVQARDDGGLPVRDFQFQKFTRRAQLRSQFRKQI
jgi:hypothetical protein